MALPGANLLPIFMRWACQTGFYSNEDGPLVRLRYKFGVQGIYLLAAGGPFSRHFNHRRLAFYAPCGHSLHFFDHLNSDEGRPLFLHPKPEPTMIRTHTGFILTREHVEEGGAHRLRYSGICDAGPFEIIITTDRPLFFIQRDAILPGESLHSERRPLALTTFDGVAVDALYFRTQPHLYRARKACAELGIRTFEADVYPAERFIMERFIHGSIEFHGACEHRGGILRCVNPTMRPADYTPQFGILSLDIETGQHGELYSIACHITGRGTSSMPSGIVLMVDDKAPPPAKGPTPQQEEPLPGYTWEPLKKGERLYRLPNETEVLHAFIQVVERLDPDVIIGWHVVGFDLLFLERVFRRWGVAFGIGRDRRVPKIREIRKGVYRVEITGRIVIDGPPALRGAFYTFDNFRLETVASALLGTGKDIGEATDKVAEIERRFRNDKRALATYNLMDCHLVTGIYKKTGLMDHLFKRAIISGLAMDRVGMSVAAFDHFMLPRTHRKGRVAPNVKDVESMGHAAGGWVFSTEAGFYEHIVVLDFKSLYPSIIRTFKIDPLSRITAQEDPLQTPMGIAFSRSFHVLPDGITHLMEKRQQAKEEEDPHLSQAIKILMNSFYGVMGTPGCRFYHPDLPTAITGTGQWVLKATRDYLEEEGYAVIYGDTDSVFVRLKEREVAQGAKAAHRLASRVNAWMDRKIEEEFGLSSHLELEFEKHFTRFFLPATRGGGASAKKRYAGLVLKDGEETLLLTGLEFVRSDWTRLARNFQYELLHRIFHDQEVIPWLKKTVADLKAHRHDDDLVYQKRLTKPPGEYTKAIPPHVRAARLLGKAGEHAKESRYLMTRRGPIPVALPHPDIDYAHYIEKQITPIFDAVMIFFDLSFAEVMGGRQLPLFSPEKTRPGRDEKA